MCLIPPSHVLDGVPRVANVVYPPFVEAATGVTTQSSPTPPNQRPPCKQSFCQPPPPPNSWCIHREVGDGSCGFRALARHILGDAERHLQIRSEIVQYLSAHRNNPSFHISDGINLEHLIVHGEPPRSYSSYDEYLRLMSNPFTYMG